MDLGICPRCGAEWRTGLESCSQCGFVAIGAGLSKLAEVEKKKKRKKKPKKYREPGSATPLLSALLMIGIGVWGIESRPWERHWETVRVWFGAIPTRSLSGDWEIQSLTPISYGMQTAIARQDTIRGAVQFGSDGKIRMVLDYPPQSEVIYTGKYNFEGTKLTLNGLDSDPIVKNTPKELLLQVSWQGDDSMMASVAPAPSGKPTAMMMLHKLNGQEPHRIAQRNPSEGGED